MGQITIYLDPETEEKLKTAVEGSGESTSRWIANLIRTKVSRSWPLSVLALGGTWADDFPEPEELRKPQGRDVRRRKL
jgi:hypothetical protein